MSRQFENILSYYDCFLKAKSYGYKYVGLSVGHICYADNDFGSYGAADERECDVPCFSDNGLPLLNYEVNCGSSFTNSVYYVSDV